MCVGEKKSIPASIEPPSSSTPSPYFCINPIGLYPAGINLEDKSSFFIVKCIQINSDLVVSIGFVSFSKTGSDCIWVGIIAADSNVKIVFVISQIGHSFFRGLSSFLRFELSEGVKDSALLPEWVFQFAVYFGWRCEFWNYYMIIIFVFLRKRK